MKNIFKVLFIIAGIALLIYGVFFFRTIIMYILLAGIFSMIGRPIMTGLQKVRFYTFKLPSSLCAGLTLLTFYLVIVGFFLTFFPLIYDEIQMVASSDSQKSIQHLGKYLTDIDNFVLKYNLTEDKKTVSETLKESISSWVNMSSISTVFSGFLGALGNIFAAVFSISFISFFFLTDQSLFYNFAITFVPPKYTPSFDRIVQTTRSLLSRYFFGIFMQVLLVGGLVTTFLLILGIQNALLIGVFAGLANIIPYLGPIIGMCFGIFVVVTNGLNQELAYLFPTILKTLAVFSTVQLLDNSIFQPIIFSNSIRAHPLEIFLVISVAATIAGVSGMVLGIPIYTVVRVVAIELLSEFQFIERQDKAL